MRVVCLADAVVSPERVARVGHESGLAAVSCTSWFDVFVAVRHPSRAAVVASTEALEANGGVVRTLRATGAVTGVYAVGPANEPGALDALLRDGLDDWVASLDAPDDADRLARRLRAAAARGAPRGDAPPHAPGLSAAVDRAPLVLFALDGRGVLTLWEGGALPRLARRAGDGVGRSVHEALRDEPWLVECARRALAGEAVSETGVLGGRTLDARLLPVRAAGGVVAGVVGAAVEVTEERGRAQAAGPLTTEAGYEALIERSPDAIFVHRDGRFVYVNRAALECLGLGDAADLVGRSVSEVVHPDDHASVHSRIEEALATGAAAPFREQRLLRRDGGLVVVEVSSLSLPFRGAPAVASIARDVTARKALEARLMLADRMASIGQLAAGVAHEINNPLAYVLANLTFATEYLAAFGPDADPDALPTAYAELEAALREASEGAERVRSIVRDLKTFARGDDGARGPVDIRRVLESAINMSWNEIRHRARLEKDYGPVPRVRASESRLGQVFLNLLVNAAHAVPEGRAGDQRIRVATRRADDGRAVIEVSDTGAGIPTELVSRIFDPFFTTKPVGVGTGLGLAICRSIVESIGGEIAVESQVGVGTTFRVLLPAAGSGSIAAVAAPASASSAAPRRRGTVLVVDDDPLVTASTGRLLGGEHTVVVCTSPREALRRIAARERFDVILCDLLMPEMNGPELHAAIASVAPEQASRMVFVTGGVFLPSIEAFLQRVPNARLDKPLTSARLRAVVRERIG